MSNKIHVPAVLATSLRCLALAGVVAGVAACASGPPRGIQAVQDFEIERYLGRWYEIARLDHRFERGLENVTATYALRPDGSLDVVNRGYDGKRDKWRSAEGRGRFIGDPRIGALKVSFFGPFYGGYNIVSLSRDYQWAIVMGPNRDYLWILARERELPAALRDRLIAQVRPLGVNPDELIWVPQDRPQDSAPTAEQAS